VPVTIIENPVESISYKPVKPIEIKENTNGEWDDFDDFFYYDTPDFSIGDKLTVNYKSGSSVTYTYFDNDYDDSGKYGWYDDVNKLKYDVLKGSDQYSEHWTVGSDNYYTVSCLKVETQVPVTIVHVHNYKSKVTTKATLKTNGVRTYTCTSCDNTYKETISKIGTIKLAKTSYTYTGKTIKPAVTVKDSKGKTLKNGTDYTVTYPKSSKAVNKYTVTVTFKGNYSGSKKLTYTVVPKGTTLSKVTAKSKSFVATWKKQATQTTGYQIQYSTSSKFTKGNKTVTISKNKTTSTTVKKLSAKKKYYVRVRTYKKVGNTKYYSAWSKAKAVTTKK
jgi:hypothetical protein